VLCLTWEEEAVVDNGEEVGVGSGVGSFPLQQVYHALQAARVHSNLGWEGWQPEFECPIVIIPKRQQCSHKLEAFCWRQSAINSNIASSPPHPNSQLARHAIA